MMTAPHPSIVDFRAADYTAALYAGRLVRIAKLSQFTEEEFIEVDFYFDTRFNAKIHAMFFCLVFEKSIKSSTN